MAKNHFLRSVFGSWGGFLGVLGASLYWKVVSEFWFERPKCLFWYPQNGCFCNFRCTSQHWFHNNWRNCYPMNILSKKWANISYICKKCFPDFAKGYSSDNDFVNCSEISVVTWTINHVRLLQFPKKCVFTPLYYICSVRKFHITSIFLAHLMFPC